jgi:hypothetical protein
MFEWLNQFANPNFMPHGHCYLWREDILYTHVISDIAIGLSYYVIPIILAVLLIKRKERFPHKDVLMLFIAFIFFCGTTHFVNIYVTWHPAYEYQGWLKALTAFTSVLTVIVLAPKLPIFLELPGKEETYEQTKLELAALKQKNTEMHSIYTSTLDREERIIALKNEVNALLKASGKARRYEM